MAPPTIVEISVLRTRPDGTDRGDGAFSIRVGTVEFGEAAHVAGCTFDKAVIALHLHCIVTRLAKDGLDAGTIWNGGAIAIIPNLLSLSDNIVALKRMGLVGGRVAGHGRDENSDDRAAHAADSGAGGLRQTRSRGAQGGYLGLLL